MSDDPTVRTDSAAPSIVPDVSRRLAQLGHYRVDFDETAIAPADKPVLGKLVAATRIMQELFVRQLDPSSPALRETLATGASDSDALRYFDLMAGPWDALAHDEPFVGNRPRPPGAGFYPPDMSKDELDRHVAAHPEDRVAFESYFTVIARRAGQLAAVPYSEAYRPWLEQAAGKLRGAVADCRYPSLKRFLELRADAFLSNDYVESDMAWMDVTGPIEITIGPYETYADQLFSYKASFECFVCLRDQEASRQLAGIGAELGALERNLPLDEHYQQQAAGKGESSPIDVVQLLCNSGQPGMQTAAYALPNDERVRMATGTKKVLLKNMMEGKFEIITKPIAAKVLATDQLDLLDPDAFFTYILMHEVAHGVGPVMAERPDGTTSEVSRALSDLYSGIEEAKADITGLLDAHLLIGKGFYPSALERQLPVVYLATAFRQMRFGVKEAHGKGVVTSVNFLLEQGGLVHHAKSGRFGVNFDRFTAGVRELAGHYLRIEATGDYDGARAFFDRYAKLTPELEAAIARIGTDVPIDVAPEFTIFERAASW